MKTLLAAILTGLCCYGCTGHSENMPPLDMIVLSNTSAYAPYAQHPLGGLGVYMGGSPTNTPPSTNCPSNIWDGDVCITTPGWGSL
jgi:hypothetical protein